MKRMHLHVSVPDLGQSIQFYETLFGAPPSVVKADYAKWMLEDPLVNFAISQRERAAGVDHVGIQVESEEELADVYARLRTADRPIREEGATTCCYAKSEKSWIADPQGVVWETFHTTGEAVNYGAGPELLQLASDNAAVGACCMPTIPAAEARPVASCCS